MLSKTIKEITGYFNQKFPESPVKVKTTKGYIGIMFTIVDKYICNIEYNDPMFTAFDIFIEDDGSLMLYLSNHSRFAVKPAPGSRLHHERVKIPFRKTTGNEDKIIKAMKRYIDRLRDTFDTNKDRLLNKEQIEERFLNQ